MSDDREWERRRVNKMITLQEYIRAIVDDTTRHQEVKAWIDLIGAPGVERLMAGDSLKDVLEKRVRSV